MAKKLKNTMLYGPKARALGFVPVAGDGYVINKYVGVLTDVEFWQVEIAENVGEHGFRRLNQSCKMAGGTYSRLHKGLPGGFAFLSEAAAVAWAAKEFGGVTA